MEIKAIPSKKKIKKRTKEIGATFFSGTALEIIDRITDIQVEYEGNVSFKQNGGYYGKTVVIYESIETDREFATRVKKEEKQMKSDMTRLKKLLQKYEVTDVGKLG